MLCTFLCEFPFVHPSNGLLLILVLEYSPLWARIMRFFFHHHSLFAPFRRSSPFFSLPLATRPPFIASCEHSRLHHNLRPVQARRLLFLPNSILQPLSVHSDALLRSICSLLICSSPLPCFLAAIGRPSPRYRMLSAMLCPLSLLSPSTQP